jgi:hypothetical protein
MIVFVSRVWFTDAMNRRATFRHPRGVWITKGGFLALVGALVFFATSATALVILIAYLVRG